MSNMFSGEMYHINNQIVSKGSEPVTVTTIVIANPQHNLGRLLLLLSLYIWGN